jgi:hypothetical protein
MGWAVFEGWDISLMAGDTLDAQTRNLLELLDQLEMLVRNGRRVAIVNLVGIDEHRALMLIDYLRMAIPTELQQARRILRERQEIVLSAQLEAQHIVEQAHAQAEYLLSRHGVLAEARQRGEAHLRESAESARRTTEGAEQYALSVVDGLEAVVREQLHEIERARDVLREAQVAHADAMPARRVLDR